ncbi:MAG: hypothetical protein JST39_01790, partial [Bacteroidetes bacterium]|nr:hypothetical protein [Bacteroidota bacterium]
MKKKAIPIALITVCIGLPSFFAPPAPADKIKTYYAEQFTRLSATIQDLLQAEQADSSEAVLQHRFVTARLVYKKLEPYIEYYSELDAPLFNGIATEFVEEEDPAADHQPEGFQVIEALLYPHYDSRHKKELLDYTTRLLSLTKGLAGNTTLFKPDEYLPDALMEELYRIQALGITGFDSPLAGLSLSESTSALESIRFALHNDAPLTRVMGKDTAAADRLLQESMQYLDQHPSFDGFDRMTFITGYMDPICRHLGAAIRQLNLPPNPGRPGLIKKEGS